jgi:hypothetical protein
MAESHKSARLVMMAHPPHPSGPIADNPATGEKQEIVTSISETWDAASKSSAAAGDKEVNAVASWSHLSLSHRLAGA